MSEAASGDQAQASIGDPIPTTGEEPASTDLNLVFRALPDGIIVLDESGTVEWCNPAASEFLGTNLVGKPFGLPVSNVRSTAEIDVLGPDGDQRVIELRITPFDRRGHRAFVVGVRDISATKAAVRALQRSEERYALAVRGANDGLWDWDLVDNSLHVSARWHQILGLEAIDAELNVDAWFDRVHPDDADSLHRDLNDHLNGRTRLLANEHRLLHEDGDYVWVLVRGMAVFSDGSTVRLAGSLTDISSRRALEEQLRHEALHDPLTGLANRRLFLDRLDQLLRRSDRHETSFAVAVLDLDGFKQVNDTYGHEAGDHLLQTVSSRLTSAVRPSDTVSRFGGDEFAVLFNEVGDLGRARRLAQRLADGLEEPATVAGATVRVTASVGVVLSSTGLDAAGYVREADAAMFRAKRRGGGISVGSV